MYVTCKYGVFGDQRFSCVLSLGTCCYSRICLYFDRAHQSILAHGNYKDSPSGPFISSSFNRTRSLTLRFLLISFQFLFSKRAAKTGWPNIVLATRQACSCYHLYGIRLAADYDMTAGVVDNLGLSAVPL